MYLIRRLYNLQMKESNSVQVHLNEYESLSSQISSQGTTIEDELRTMILMSSLPSSWETFVITVCNASTTAIKYSEVTSVILTEAAQRKSFVKDSADEAYVVQGSTDRSNNRGRSSSRLPTNQRSQSKSRDTSKPIAAQSSVRLSSLRGVTLAQCYSAQHSVHTETRRYRMATQYTVREQEKIFLLMKQCQNHD